MFCCTLLYVHSSIAIILMGKRELVALLNLSSCCLVMVGWLFLAMPCGCLRFMIVIFPEHAHLLFSMQLNQLNLKTLHFYILPITTCKWIKSAINIHVKLASLLSDEFIKKIFWAFFFFVFSDMHSQLLFKCNPRISTYFLPFYLHHRHFDISVAQT